MKKFVLRALLIVFALGVLVVAGCGAPDRKQSENVAPADPGYVSEEGDLGGAPAPSYQPSPSGSGTPDLDVEERKVIKTAELSIETSKFDEALSAIYARVNEYGGYIQSSQESGKPPETSKDSGRRAKIVARVPEERFLDFVGGVEKTGRLEYKRLGGEDVTSAYIDRETRLSTLRTQLASLQGIMEKSTNVEDLIILQKEISNIQYQIETLTTELNRYDKLVAMSTISIFIAEVRDQQLEPVSDDFGQRIGNAFTGMINFLREAFEWIVIVLAALMPMLVVGGVITIITLLIVRIVRRRRYGRPLKDMPYKSPVSPAPPIEEVKKDE